MIGRRTRLDSIITWDGVSLAGADISTPKAEKANAPSTTPISNWGTETILASVALNPIASGNTESEAPNNMPARTSPARMAESEAGETTSRS